MCSECHMHPCHPSCPNAPEPKAIYRCKHCYEGICEGDEMVEIEGKHYHLECVEDMTTKELLVLLGYEVEVA